MLSYQQKVLEAARRLAVRISDGAKEIVLELDARAADALARELALQASLIGEDALCAVQVNGGRDFLYVDKQVASEIARALIAGKLRCEELEHAERIARDSAILLRAGSNFALSARADIIEEAKKIAAWDSQLRNCMPGGVKSEEAFGLPCIIVKPLKPKGVH